MVRLEVELACPSLVLANTTVARAPQFAHLKATERDAQEQTTETIAAI